MKKPILTFFVCAATQFAFAQVLTPEVISSAGTSFINGSNVLDWTLGEPVTSTFDNGTNQLSQGFHQNDMLITSMDEAVNSEISVFPNPTANMVQINFSKVNEAGLIELYSVEGKLLSSQSINTSTVSKVDMSAFAGGTYLLKIKSSTLNQSYQIIKTK